MLPGETIHSGATKICIWGKEFDLEVMKSNVGYYIGTRCNTRGCNNEYFPYSRESHYYSSKEEADKALSTNTVNWRT